MEKQIQTYVTSPKLQDLLTWIEGIVSESETKIKLFVKRMIACHFALAIFLSKRKSVVYAECFKKIRRGKIQSKKPIQGKGKNKGNRQTSNDNNKKKKPNDVQDIINKAQAEAMTYASAEDNAYKKIYTFACTYIFTLFKTNALALDEAKTFPSVAIRASSADEAAFCSAPADVSRDPWLMP